MVQDTVSLPCRCPARELGVKSCPSFKGGPSDWMTNPCTSNEAEQESRVPPPLRYIEFYAGIGGWSLALQQVVQHRRLECCAAWDHSDLCVRVCQHNGLSVCRQQRIELITVVPVADVWVLSPPCQPHTRQHTHQDAELQDSRSQSFLHICRLLQEQPLQNKRPRCILLENVVGFEASQSCRVYWRRAVHGYVLAHFHLTPTQVGMPNDRPRYYCVAVQRDCWAATTAPWAAYFNDDPERDSNQKKDASFTVHTSLPELGVVPIDHVDLTKIPTISTFLDDDSTNTDSLVIPPAVLQRSSSWCLDIVAPTSRRSSWFTSGYGKYMRGTGSVLLLENPERRRKVVAIQILLLHHRPCKIRTSGSLIPSGPPASATQPSATFPVRS